MISLRAQRLTGLLESEGLLVVFNVELLYGAIFLEDRDERPDLKVMQVDSEREEFVKKLRMDPASTVLLHETNLLQFQILV